MKKETFITSKVDAKLWWKIKELAHKKNIKTYQVVQEALESYLNGNKKN